MLEVQKYLKNGKTFEHLEKEFAISSNFDDNKKRAILNYCQLDSPKHNPIVKECRGLVINPANIEILAKPFPRFFNYGECPSSDGLFKFDRAIFHEKLDGSLIILYWWDGAWRVNTRNSYGMGKFSSLVDLSWYQYFMMTIDEAGLSKLDKNLTYCFELVGPYNTVVVPYIEPQSYLLGIFDKEGYEYQDLIEMSASFLNCKIPQCFNFLDYSSLAKYVDEQEYKFEGVVAFDGITRLKIKNPKYVAIHHMAGNNQEKISSKKNIVEFVRRGEQDEVINYFPVFKDVIMEYVNKYNKVKQEVLDLWEKSKDVLNRAEFASLVNKSPWSSILFEAYDLKNHKNIKPDVLDLLKRNDKLLIKKL